jgi:hypothetical protein
LVAAIASALMSAIRVLLANSERIVVAPMPESPCGARGTVV